jgi:hypothetical protein
LFEQARPIFVAHADEDESCGRNFHLRTAEQLRRRLVLLSVNHQLCLIINNAFVSLRDFAPLREFNFSQRRKGAKEDESG